MKADIRQILLTSLDEELSEQEKEALKNALEKSAVLRHEKETLQQDAALLAKYDATFSPGFARKVVKKVYAPRQTDFFPLFKKILIAATAAILALLISVYYFDGDLSGSSILGLSGLSSDEILFALSNF